MSLPELVIEGRFYYHGKIKDLCVGIEKGKITSVKSMRFGDI